MTNGYTKRYSTPQVISEMQSSAQMRYYLTSLEWLLFKSQELISVVKDV